MCPALAEFCLPEVETPRTSPSLLPSAPTPSQAFGCGPTKSSSNASSQRNRQSLANYWARHGTNRSKASFKLGNHHKPYVTQPDRPPRGSEYAKHHLLGWFGGRG